MTKAELYFMELIKDIPDAKASKMFGSLCMKMPNGKSAAMFWEECIVVRLAGGELEKAIKLKGAKLFEPMQGRPMKDWVQIPFEQKDKWKMFTEFSASTVKAIEKKPTKKKK